ncbi:hypothetical protein NE857_00330 [Nocardiopsis exhalans]|uniref:Uncharacterized protein n=1 Tax=Nocardiopsis exhalans TaxID=163604 RepID=A0ABY5D8U1_9ACTN|nr:hypothetical protein [Nocardiopsis exhalans]USY20166.1 hypothetical protein NE857_00330 [Nocardiopsis exhalans]
MSLLRKGSRRITVDGADYRWRIRHRPTYSQGNGWTNLVFAVEYAESPGRALVVETGNPRPDNWLGLGPAVSITPVVVAAAIRRALKEGWSPQATGSPHHLTLTEAEVPETAEDFANQ